MNLIKSVLVTFCALVGLSGQVLAVSANWRCEFPTFEEPITFVTGLGTGKGKAIGNGGTTDVGL